jgi:hypothetical protein
MAWHYYDENGEKIGPLRGRDLRRLAQEGVITQETRVEDENGRTARAKHVTGLTFGNATQSVADPFSATMPVTADPFVTPAPFAPTVPAVPEPPPVTNLYCTNCGNAVSEQAVACMSCGAKPTGHKKFCRQCGIALNPEQVVCVHCGAAISGGILPNVTVPNINNIKKIPKPVVITGIAIIVGLLLLLFVVRAFGEKPLTPVEKTEADKLIAEHGKDAMLYYLEAECEKPESKKTDADAKRVLKYCKYFVSQGADIDAKDRDNHTPLLYASALGTTVEYGKTMNFLISKGADPNIQDGQGRTFLHALAATGGNDKYLAVEAAKSLVAKGVNVNTKDRSGETALHCAVQNGNIPMAKFLVQKGANINEKGSQDFTLLHYAVQSGNVAMVKFLISKKADVNAIARIRMNGEVRDVPPRGMVMFLPASDARETMLEILEKAGAAPLLPSFFDTPSTPDRPSQMRRQRGGPPGGR